MSTLVGDSDRLLGREFLGNFLLQKAGLATFLFVSMNLAGAQSKGLPPGPMQAKVKAACTQCHAASKITSQHKTRQEWSTQLDKMIGLGAEVPDAQRAAFLNYLSKNFGPEKGAKAGVAKGGD
jgi:ADP-ribosylglycohydrolase